MLYVKRLTVVVQTSHTHTSSLIGLSVDYCEWNPLGFIDIGEAEKLEVVPNTEAEYRIHTPKYVLARVLFIVRHQHVFIVFYTQNNMFECLCLRSVDLIRFSN